MQNATIDPHAWTQNYSPNNARLIASQCPHASAIASYRQWQERGRQVRKGEKAIRILAPIAGSDRDKDGNEKPMRYREVPVFDIAQTDELAKCPMCAAPIFKDDKFCGECGCPLVASDTTPAPKPDYTIATEAGAVIAEVTHTDLTNTLTYTDILTAPMAQALANTAKRLQAQARQYVADRKAARKGKGARSRWEIQDDEQRAAIEESVRILVLPDGSILTGGLLADDYDAIPSGCASSPIEAVIMADDAKFLASCMKQTKQARMFVHGSFLVIETPSVYPGKWDSMRFACSFTDANPTRTGWPVRNAEPVAA